jgi:N-acetylmuramic acid 6-phosphate etherase
MQAWNVGINDVVVGIAASGTTPYVIGAVREAKKRGILTACITCNPDSPVSKEVDIPIEAIVGPEFVTGSTRMKSGTAQKLILNMISTSTMIRLGHVKGSKMIDMQLTNAKLVDRGSLMIMEETGIDDYDLARRLLLLHRSVRKAVDTYTSAKK